MGAARKGRNPKTGEEIEIKASKLPALPHIKIYWYVTNL
ncbi:MAG: HU family DNA-binding protein [Desulfurellaceae bacterium]|nr:HU family DNA-binding protein [Desulfurellaceae bacterium]